MDIDLASDLVRLTGYDLTGHWLATRIAEHLARSRTPDARRLAYENLAIQGLPATLEPLAVEPLEEPLPVSSPTLVALHLLGLFHTTLFGPTLGGVVRGRSYAFDLNVQSSTVYPARCDDDGPLELEGYIVLEDGRPEAMEAVRNRWARLQELEITDSTSGAKSEAAAAFFAAYPGLTRSQGLVARAGLATSVSVPEPTPAPATLMRALAAARVIAPSLLAARGLPPAGAAPAAAREALEAIEGPIGLREHEEAAARGAPNAARPLGDGVPTAGAAYPPRPGSRSRAVRGRPLPEALRGRRGLRTGNRDVRVRVKVSHA